MLVTSAYRSIDGSGNNLRRPEWGQAGTPLKRVASPAYEDGLAEPSGADRPNPRLISNQVMNQRGLDHDSRNLSGMVWAWGQFIDHDMDFTPNPGVPDWNIAVPAGDRHFDPRGTGTVTIPFSRSSAHPGTGVETPREQTNAITAWLDASMVYGSDAGRAAALRSFEGGRLRTSEGDMLPFNTVGLPNDNPMGRPAESLFLAGDVRANENVGLLSLQTLFVREHNRLCAELAADDPSLSDEELYQKARKIVGAEVQAITFNEYLPALLGDDALPAYAGYDPSVDPSISNLFATAAFRMGHSQVEPIVWRDQADGQPIPERDLALLHAFFAPGRLQEGGIEPLLRGLSRFIQEPTDEKITPQLRNMLFGRPGSGGLDLASLNIQRGRDHGLPDYNTVRQSLGLPPVESFSQISSRPEVARALESTFGSLDRLDPWVGMLCEDPAPGAAVGPTVRAALVDQFVRLRDGDRFYYQNDPELAGLELEDLRLVDIMRRNTSIADELDDEVFFGERRGRRLV